MHLSFSRNLEKSQPMSGEPHRQRASARSMAQRSPSGSSGLGMPNSAYPSLAYPQLFKRKIKTNVVCRSSSQNHNRSFDPATFFIFTFLLSENFKIELFVCSSFLGRLRREIQRNRWNRSGQWNNQRP